MIARAVRERAQAPLVARYTTSEAKKRAQEIADERGSSAQGDLAEAGAELGATEREVTRRAAAAFKAKNVPSQDFFDDEFDRIMAGIEIRQEFVCDRLTAWGKLIISRSLWRTKGMGKDAAAQIKDVQNKLAALVTLLTGHDLKAQRKAIDAAEAAISAFRKDFGAAHPERCDLLMMVKRYTLGHERRKLVIAERISEKYGMRLDSMELVKANKKSYGTKSLEKFVDMMEPEVFSLEELKGIETVLARYAPMLGANRAKKLGKQPLTTFGRTKYGIDFDDAGTAQIDPDTRGESFAKSKTVGMYDAGSTASQFPTGMQQFRGTLAHELSHALIEDVKNQNGVKTINAYALATGVWKSVSTTKYRKSSNAKTWKAMQKAGKEPPITTYGATNAQEDLADAIKFLFEDPAQLKAKCPKRYKWIIQNLSTFFETTWFTGLPAAP